MKRLSVLLAAAITAVGAAGASATVVDPLGFSAFSPTDSNNKSVSTACPAGMRLTGAGGDVSGGSGQVIFDDLTPSADLTSVTVKGAEDENGFPSGWEVRANAFCSFDTPGLERVAATSPLDSSNKSATATCPSGKRVIGTGADINAGAGQVGVDDLRPDTGLTSVTVQALEDQNGQPGPWNITAYAICASAPTGLERVTATSGLDSTGNKFANAACPAGKTLIGAGSDINAGTGQVQQTAIVPNSDRTAVSVLASEDEDGFGGPWSVTAYGICSSTANRQIQPGSPGSPSVVNFGVGCRPNLNLTGVGMEVFAAAGQVSTDYLAPDTTSAGISLREDPSGFDGFWSFNGYGICGTPLAGHEIVSTVTANDSVSPKSTAAFCPAGKRVVGGGLYQSGGSEYIDDIVPNNVLTGVTATAAENSAGTFSSWALTVYAVCASPPPGLELVRSATPLDSEEVAATTATCPAGKYLIGTGVEKLPGIQDRVMLDDIRPTKSLSALTVTAFEDESGTASDWGVAAYAICSGA
jgi:hypothetical protein